jgi:hypothetical protein
MKFATATEEHLEILQTHEKCDQRIYIQLYFSLFFDTREKKNDDHVLGRISI